ncbi:MAG: chemotaxis protein CheW [Cyclobacteriaceae bacterium]
MSEVEVLPMGTEEVSLEEVKQAAAAEKTENEETGSVLQLIIFNLGGEEYALPIDHVKEIVITPGIAKIPQTPSYIKGVSNIRGTIIAMMDLEEKFGLDSKETEANYKYTLVIESESHKVGILVRQVPSTLSVLTSKIDNSSGIMQYSSLDQDCIDGIVKSNDRMIILIDILKMIESEQLNFNNI